MVMVDQYKQLIEDTLIADLVEPHLESFYIPFVEGINLPHHDVLDSFI